MGSAARPETTSGKDSATAPRYPKLPATLPRILSPEEFEQGQHINTQDLARWNVPLAPPTALFNEQEQQQVKEGVKSVGHALADPIGTAKHIGKSIIDDLTKVFLTPTVGARNDPDARTGLLPFPNLPPGAVVSKENMPEAQTREEMHRAAINTSLNAAFAAMPQLALPARLAANTALGAYYDPEQPLRGGTAGALFGEVLHGAVKAVPKLAGKAPGLSTQDVQPLINGKPIPNAELPEHVVAAATKAQDGRIFVGNMHAEAVEASQGHIPNTGGPQAQGFLTNKGRFLSREEAAPFAAPDVAAQLKASGDPGADALDFNRFRYGVTPGEVTYEPNLAAQPTPGTAPAAAAQPTTAASPPPAAPSAAAPAAPAPAATALDQHINVSKLGLSPEGEAQFRAMSPVDGPKTVVTHAETEALARDLEMDPQKLAAHIGDWSGADALAARNVISQNTERIVSLSKMTQDLTKPVAEREAAQSEISRLTTDVATMAQRLSGERTKAGRDLNAFKIIAKNTMDPAVWLTQAERVRGGLPLTAEHQAEIIRLAGSTDRAGLISYVSKLAKTTKTEKALALWKAGLLTGLRTHEVNMVSNAAMAGLETAKDIPAAVIDRVASLVTGERSVAPSFRGNVIEAARGVGKGVKSAGSVLRNGDPAQLERWDFRQANFDNPIAQFYVNAVFRSLSAEDQIARGAAMGRALEEHIRLRARVNAKADPSHTLQEHQALLRQNPPDDVVVKAIADAEYAVFQNDNAISRGVSAFKKALPDGGRAAADVVLPFVKTPTNVVGRMADYSPIGFFTTLAGQLKEPSQRKLAQGLGRAVTGSALVWLGYALAAEGKATGQAPTSPGQRELQTMQGSGPNRVRMGKKWVDVSRVSPAGALVAVGAQLYHATKDAQGPSAALAGAGFSLGRVVLDQPMVSGLSSVLDAAKDPQHAGGRFVSRLAGSVVPTAVADVASAGDPNQRDVKGVAGSVKSRIPGKYGRESLPAKLDAFGAPLPNRNQGAGAFVNALNVAGANDDTLVQELARLKVSLPAPDKKMKIGTGKNALAHERTDDEIRTIKAAIGSESQERLRRVMALPSYAELSDEEKKARLERVINDVRTKVYAQERRTLRKEELAAKSAKP